MNKTTEFWAFLGKVMGAAIKGHRMYVHDRAKSQATSSLAMPQAAMLCVCSGYGIPRVRS